MKVFIYSFCLGFRQCNLRALPGQYIVISITQRQSIGKMRSLIGYTGASRFLSPGANYQKPALGVRAQFFAEFNQQILQKINIIIDFLFYLLYYSLLCV